MWLNLSFLLIALNLAANILPLEAVPSALTRQLLIFHEPPVESVFKQTNQITEHWITQRLDNFNHQDSRTFQMVQQMKFDFDFSIYLNKVTLLKCELFSNTNGNYSLYFFLALFKK